LEQARILIVAMPRMLHEIVESMVSAQPDMAVTGPIRRTESIAAAARRLRANVVILGESKAGVHGTPWQTLDKNPRLKVVAISGDGQRATRYELLPHQVQIADLSPEALIAAIRATMAGQVS
jgi:DNA-binding NarL/FixJ family response regulator